METSRKLRRGSLRLFLIGALASVAVGAWITRYLDGDFVADSSSSGGQIGAPGTPVIPAAAQAAGADASWLATVQKRLNEQEYQARAAVPAQLVAAAKNGAPGADVLVSRATGKILQSPNRAQNLRTYYFQDRVAVVPRTASSPDWVLQLQTTAAGRENSLSPLPVAQPQRDGNRVSYARAGIEEWFVNDDRGLEQGWTIASRPTGDGDLNIVVEVAGVEVRGTSQGVAFWFDGRPVLEYGKLHAFDADGRTLPASFEVADNRIRVRVDDSGAAYPVVVDPLLTTAAWMAEGNQAGANFGFSVASAGDVNGDGFADVIIGAQGYDGGQTDEGRAYLYLGGPGGLSTVPAWVKEIDSAGATFGSSLDGVGDVNGDGYSDVVISAYGYSNGESGEGGLFLFLGGPSGLSSTPSFSDEGNLSGVRLGMRVGGAGDINGDGYADFVAGEPYLPPNTTGRVRVYYGSPSGVPTVAMLNGDGNSISLFGGSVRGAGDVNGDGYADVLVGAVFYYYTTWSQGAAFLYLGGPGGLSATPVWTRYGVALEDYYGHDVVGAGDVNGDGYGDVMISAVGYDAGGKSWSGHVELFFGSTTGLASTPDWQLDGDLPNIALGACLGGAGDVNGDGYADILIAADGYDNPETDEGRLYLFLGGAAGPATTPDWMVETNQVGAQLGKANACAGAGDVNGDGFDDIIAGAWQYDNGETDEGAAFLYYGGADGLSTVASWSIEGNQVNASMGNAVAGAGDINGDGYADVLVGAKHYDNGETNEGVVFVYAGSVSGVTTTPAALLEVNVANAYFGTSVASAGDVNADGYADVIIGAPGYANSAGAAYVFPGGPGGLSSVPIWTMTGSQNLAYFGGSVAGAGDVNGDGFADIIVGASRNDNGEWDEGSAYLYYGSASGPATSASWMAEGNQDNAYFGQAVAGAGDVDGDGYDDIIIGADGFDTALVDAGAVFLYRGGRQGPNATPDWMATGVTEGERFGLSVAAAGDVDGDGFADIV
ncbi:MAG: hypothetical protein D6761_10220, partial [Candidatus Dadabacteria bacterium]